MDTIDLSAASREHHLPAKRGACPLALNLRASRIALALILFLMTVSSGWCAIGIDVVRFTDRSTSSANITTTAVTTAAPNELLLAFIATDSRSLGITVTSMTGANLTWVLVRRTNAQQGTAEIWRAFAPTPLTNASVTANLSQSVAASMTVVAFSGTDPSGTNGSGAIGRTNGASAASGAPSATVATSRDGSWVFGVGADWDRAITRTVGPNQTMVHQYLASVGDTYWVQRQNNPTPLNGTQVPINDTAPTTDRYNLSVVEILAAPVIVGNFSFSGNVSPSDLGTGTVLTLTGSRSGTTMADNAGNYAFTGLADGTYTVTPSKSGVIFTPSSRPVTIAGGSLTGIDFSAAPIPTFSLSGTVTPSSLGIGTLLTITGAASRTATADISGGYSFSGLPNGTYTVTPSKISTSFVPTSRSVTLNNASATGINFAASVAQITGNYPDLRVIIPPGQTSITGTGASRVLLYTHDTYNGGSGPLEIQPVYNAATGNYEGQQHIYSRSGSTWSLFRNIIVAGAFVFHAEHGHFHFPLARFGLYVKNPDGSVGAPAALSEKNGFCIGDSFILANSGLPNAGTFGYSGGTCANPTALRGLSIAGVDEYDRSDPGQSITIGNLPNGNYWLIAEADPDNYLAESDENNNVTYVDLTITGNTVVEHQIITPVLSPLPEIALTAPSAGNVTGIVQLTASTTSGTGVQFILDGSPFGSVVPNAPYILDWDTGPLPNGNHSLAAQTTDAAGRTNTSAVTVVTVTHLSTEPPVVTVNGPTAGSTVTGTIQLGATATAQNGVPSVQFFVDGNPFGSPVAAPPFMLAWDSSTVSDGTHSVSATATDQVGLVGTATPVSFMVDNSHPANLIGIDTTVFRDTGDTMQSPAFSTRAASELIVALVTYDGPNGRPQTATVSGAGLTWQLAKRSNIQGGTSEVWSARSTAILTNVSVTSQPGIVGYHGSLTVIAFTNASNIGTVAQSSNPAGAPNIFLPGVLAGSWVFAAGNDWDRAVARTPVSGQVLVHQRIDTAVGDTFWVQSTAAPSPIAGMVEISDTAPTNDQWNYVAVEIVATRQ